MRASKSSFESYKFTRILCFANFICSSVSGPKVLRKRIFYFEIFFLRERFSTITPHFFNPISKNVLQLFTAIEFGKTQTHFFSALGPETDEQMKLAKNKIRVNL